ncbi:MAG: DUF6515 family protein [Robiginitalea sp.]|nr:DUF6515 family protein [Robiginitalea sp.]
MKLKLSTASFLKATLAVLFVCFLTPLEVEAQRMGHRASRQTMSRPPARSSRPAARPATRPSSRPSTTRPSTSNRPSINGGYQKATTRDISRPSSRPSTGTRPSNRAVTTDRSTSKVTRPSNSRETPNRGQNGGNRVSDRSNNRVNVDNSRRGNRNINIDNSRTVNVNRRNTYVRTSPRVYVRPPYIWGGFHFYCHRPYYWHPYRPYYWGPVWHPWGYFVTTLATTAIIISITNDSGNQEEYHYEEGNYYLKTADGFEVVQAPVGATVSEIPETAQKVEVTENTYNYYYGGAYYEKNAEGYTVVPATAGTIVPHLPEGGEEVKVGDRTYVKFGETYYQPIQVDGKDMYEIVEVTPEDA